MKLFENDVISIRLLTVGFYDIYEGTHKNYNVNLPSYELIFTLSGEISVFFSDKNVLDTVDAVRYLPKGINKGAYSLDALKDSTCIDIYFDTEDAMPDSAFVLKNMSELKSHFTKIYNIWQTKRSGYYAECMSIMYDIVRRIRLHGEKYITSEKSRKIIPSFEYMLSHYFEHDFDYEKMCGESGLSYSYFKEIFIKQYGISPVKYVTNLRIERAKELLITGQYTITEIAEKCGFDSVYYFSKVFKSHTGVCPKDYINFELTEK